ncbi:MAG: gamma carbonic anhydrase family protein [Bacteroidales bacterium]|nr:gamma carbonic anhydrase family protein [Bacteroidales bacterium]
MALIKTINRNGEVLTPRIAEGVIMMENATVVGDVAIGEGTTLWFNAVLRGDVNTITIGNRVNIQDGSVLHTLYQKSTIVIGNDVSIGHNVVIHGAHIHDLALIGMGAVVMDDAEVGEGAIVAAGSVVLSRTKIGPNELWGGAPAKFIKMVDPAQSREINQKIARNYLMYSKWYSPDEQPGEDK